MIGNLVQCAWHADCATSHLNVGIAQHTRHLTAAIETGHDMTAGDLYPCMAFHLTGFRIPVASGIREETGTAAKDAAVESTSARGYAFSTLGIIAVAAFILVIW